MDQKQRMKWWIEARFGLFIHWGLYSIPARGEWVMLMERIPPKEYAKLAQQFKPPKSFSTDSWVKLARDAGMRYMVLTTRHHDGFCLFDSKASDFTSVKTAAGRDFVAEYVKSCRKYGMRIGFYYSLLDWRFPGYFTGREKDPQSVEAMVQQAHEQVRELMTQYGRIDILWYDGGWVPGVEAKDIPGYWKSVELNTMVRKLQPEIIINNRAGIEEDFSTPEQVVQAAEEGRYWETCMTIGDSCGWGYIKNNPNMKTVPQLIQHLVNAAAGGGNYLLNVGPKPDGSIQAEYTTRLKKIGKWMKANGESVYGTDRRSPLFGSQWDSGNLLGQVTVKGSTAYLHFFRWPGGTGTVTGIKNNILAAYFLATGKHVSFEKTDDGKVILKKMPVAPPDPYDTVIVLQLDGKPEPFIYSGMPL